MIRGDGVLRLPEIRAVVCQGLPLHAIDATTYATTPLPVVGDDTRPRAEGNDNYREEVLTGGENTLSSLLRHGRALQPGRLDGGRGVRERRGREARKELVAAGRAVVRPDQRVELGHRVVEVQGDSSSLPV